MTRFGIPGVTLLVSCMMMPGVPDSGSVADSGTTGGEAGGRGGGIGGGGGSNSLGGGTGGGVEAGGAGGGYRICTRNTGGSDYVPATEFITSVPMAADFGGRRQANERCELAASGAGLTASFVAWLADSTSWPMDEYFQGRLWFDGPDLFIPVNCADPYSNACGDRFTDEHGRSRDAGSLYWAGYQFRCRAGGTCQNWTSLTGPADLGAQVRASIETFDHRTGSCSERHHLLCRAVSAAGIAPVTGVSRRVFVTSTTWSGDLGGWLGADAKCNALAVDAGFISVGGLGSFRAYVSEGANHPAVRFRERNEAWRLASGALTFRNVKSFATTPTTPPIEDERGQRLDGGLIWTGAATWLETTGNDCSGWTSTTSGGTVGAIGSVTEQWTNDGVRGCSSLAHLLCFEQ